MRETPRPARRVIGAERGKAGLHVLPAFKMGEWVTGRGSGGPQTGRGYIQ